MLVRVEERGGVDREGMIFPWAQWVEGWEVGVGVVAWLAGTSEAGDVDADVLGADVCYYGFAEAVVGDAEEAHEAVEGPDGEGGVEPVFVASGVAEAVYEVVLHFEAHTVRICGVMVRGIICD